MLATQYWHLISFTVTMTSQLTSLVPIFDGFNWSTWSKVMPAFFIVTPRLALSCNMCSGGSGSKAWSCIRASVWWCTSIKLSCTQDWCEWNAKLSQCSRLAGARQIEGPHSVGYVRQSQRPTMMRGEDESPQWNNPRVPCLVLETMSWIERSQVYHIS